MSIEGLAVDLGGADGLAIAAAISTKTDVVVDFSGLFL